MNREVKRAGKNFMITAAEAAVVAGQGCDLEWLYRVYEEKGIQIRLEYRESVAGQFDIIKLNASQER